MIRHPFSATDVYIIIVFLAWLVLIAVLNDSTIVVGALCFGVAGYAMGYRHGLEKRY